MPSSFLQYAQDFDGDGKRDIWKSTPDVFASIANYLGAHGWNSKQGWGREVKLPPGLSGDALHEAAPLQTNGCLAQRQMTIRLPLAKWSDLGVKTAAGTALPRAAIDAALISTGRRHFLLYPNYDAILSYNCVHAYGLSVALLSDRLR
jgi:membrane-bound lytic murein transglycosylase B